MAEKIYIVEDDPTIASALRAHLSAWGYQVGCAQRFDDVLGPLEAFEPDLVLLDIVLPFYNGYHWCTLLRRKSRVPVIFVSSASDNMNIVMAMNMGGDDFIAKPFDLNVLTAKVQAVLRRCVGTERDAMAWGMLSLDLGKAVLSWKETRLDLTKNELRILQSLFQAQGGVVSRDRLMEQLWQTDSYVDENTLSVNIARLRRKLDQAGMPELIQTRKGLGYALKEKEALL